MAKVTRGRTICRKCGTLQDTLWALETWWCSDCLATEIKLMQAEVDESERTRRVADGHGQSLEVEVKRLRAIINHHHPLLCGVCGDAIHDTGNVCVCGFPLCECGDTAVLTVHTTETKPLRKLLADILDDATSDVNKPDKRLWPIRVDHYRWASKLLKRLE